MKYIKPEVQIVKLNSKDIIKTSGFVGSIKTGTSSLENKASVSYTSLLSKPE